MIIFLFVLFFLQRDFTIIQNIDLSDNQLQDEGVLYLSMPLRLCTILNSLVKNYKIIYFILHLNFERI